MSIAPFRVPPIPIPVITYHRKAIAIRILLPSSALLSLLCVFALSLFFSVSSVFSESTEG